MVVSFPSTNVTVPDPLPVIVRLKVACDTLNVAVQLCAAVIVPPQSPLKPTNVDPLSGLADSVTLVPIS